MSPAIIRISWNNSFDWFLLWFWKVLHFEIATIYSRIEIFWQLVNPFVCEFDIITAKYVCECFFVDHNVPICEFRDVLIQNFVFAPLGSATYCISHGFTKSNRIVFIKVLKESQKRNTIKFYPLCLLDSNQRLPIKSKPEPIPVVRIRLCLESEIVKWITLLLPVLKEGNRRKNMPRRIFRWNLFKEGVHISKVMSIYFKKFSNAQLLKIRNLPGSNNQIPFNSGKKCFSRNKKTLISWFTYPLKIKKSYKKQ